MLAKCKEISTCCSNTYLLHREDPLRYLYGSLASHYVSGVGQSNSQSFFQWMVLGSRRGQQPPYCFRRDPDTDLVQTLLDLMEKVSSKNPESVFTPVLWVVYSRV